jgi:hypothetical protein
MTTSREPLPETIHDFVAQQATRAVADLRKGNSKEDRSPYGNYWYRAVACMLLSGRVRAKRDGTPNMTDANRLCKEANFNQNLFERVAKLLVALGAVQAEDQGPYREGPNLSAFWSHDAGRLRTIARQAVLHFVWQYTGIQPWRPTTVHHAHLIEFLVLFFGCFRGQAVAESRVGQVFHDFSQLPKDDLVRAARCFGLKSGDVDPYGWKYWLDARGREALIAALYQAEWAYHAERDQTGWFSASPIGLGMLGLEEIPPAPELAVLFQALPILSVFAGAGLAHETLVPLFRHGVVKRIDQVFEFRLDRKRLAQAPASSSPAEELRRALRELEPLPGAVSSLLGTKSKLGGTIGIRWCSALVKPEDAEVLAAIREHPQLKGYLEPGAPAGYLLIKSGSNPDNFVRRCQELGFQVKAM